MFAMVFGLFSSASLGSDYPIELLNRTIDTNREPSLLPDSFGTNGHRYLIAQFESLPPVAALSAMGITSVAYVDRRTITLYIPTATEGSSLAALQPSWVGTLRAADRLSAFASEQLSEATQDSELRLLVEGFWGTSQVEVASITQQFGGTTLSRGSLPDHVALVEATPTTFANIAAQNSIAWISVPSESVADGSQEFAWCNGGGTDYGFQAQFVTAGPGWDGPGLGPANDLKMNLINATNDHPLVMPFAVQEAVMVAAFSEWARYAEICAELTSSIGLSRSIDIRFITSSIHGVPLPHDQMWGWGWFPPPHNSEPLAGNVYFDDTDTWSIAPIGNGEFDLFYAALHEIGHALGMAHSDLRFSVMNRDLPAGIPWLHTISMDDVLGIRSLYQARYFVSLPPNTTCSLPIASN